jgi:tetratricopeptide (TPR) repeat protein
VSSPLALGTILVAALAAFGGLRAGAAWAPRAAAPEASVAEERARLAAGARALRAANARLAEELARRSVAPLAAPVDDAAIGEAEIAAALARWEAANPAASGSAKAARETSVAAAALDLATMPIGELVQALQSARFTHAERQELFEKLRDAGRIDEYVAAIEALAAANPDDPDLQVALGHAYLQKLFGLGNSPEAGVYAVKSDDAFTHALELDETNWGARFSKAVSLSNWPAFLGRGPEAIEHFETLLDQQEGLPKREEFALTYLFLGNMYDASGKRDDALATWREGLELYPGFDDLRRAFEAAGGR